MDSKNKNLSLERWWGAKGVELILIEAEKLSVDDKFMKHRPRTVKEKDTKQLILEAINSKVKNFYRPIMDPTLCYGEIEFIAGKKPAVGKSYNYWSEAVKRYIPTLNTRLGTRLEYGAFLGVLIKELVKMGMTVKGAWNVVCNDSKKLGHYHNSKNGQYALEPTCSRCVCGFYDLGNTYKILAKDTDDDDFYLAGGSYQGPGFYHTIATLRKDSSWNADLKLRSSVGWLVFS